MITRRDFLSLASASLAAHWLTGTSAAKSKKSRILILGGTGFIGPYQIHYALDQGHQVSMFNRGRRREMFGDRVEVLVGNRDPKVDAGLNALKGKRKWDVVIDNSGYIPRHVKASAELLKNRCRRYVFVSSISVYDFARSTYFDESSQLAKPVNTEKMTGETYGALKAECDRMVRDILGKKATVVRPDYIVGPGDNTDRFTYWIDRVYRGGQVLAPGAPDQACSWVDVRDLSPWLIELGIRNTAGVFNASGPSSRISRRGMLWGVRAMTQEPVQFHWPSRQFLRQEGIQFPFFGNHDEIAVANAASLAAGLTYRSLADTADATIGWWRQQTPERRRRARGWLSPSREQELVQKLNA